MDLLVESPPPEQLGAVGSPGATGRRPERSSAEAFFAEAPHSFDVDSVDRLHAAAGWLLRVARETGSGPFAAADLERGRIPLLAHPHVVPDANLVTAVVWRYVVGPLRESRLPGLAVVFPGLRRGDGRTVQRAVEQLQGLASDVDVVAAGPGLPDFARVGTRSCPATLVAVSLR